MKKLFILFLVIPSLLLGQTKDEIDLCMAVQANTLTSDLEAENALDRILNVIGASKNFILTPCDKIKNALATAYRGNRYILYDKKFMNIISENTNDWSNLFILAHEVGHHINGHSIDILLYGADIVDAPSLEKKRKQELEADEFAGFVLAKLGASLSELKEVVNLIANDKDDTFSTHPNIDKRIASIEVGFNRGFTKSIEETTNYVEFEKNESYLKFGNWYRDQTKSYEGETTWKSLTKGNNIKTENSERIEHNLVLTVESSERVNYREESPSTYEIRINIKIPYEDMESLAQKINKNFLSVNKSDRRFYYYYFEIVGGGKNKDGDKIESYDYIGGWDKYRFIYDANTGNIKFQQGSCSLSVVKCHYYKDTFGFLHSNFEQIIYFNPNSDSPKNITSLFINFRVTGIIASSVGSDYRDFDRYFYAKENPDYNKKGNPFYKKRLNQIREENRDLYDTGQFDLLLEKFNEGYNYKIANVGLLQQAYNYYEIKIFLKSQYYIKEKLNQIREENQEAYNSGNFKVVLQKYNEVNHPKFYDVDQLLRHYKFYDNYPKLPESILVQPINEDLKFTKEKNHYFEFDMRGSEKAFSNKYVEQTFTDVIKNKYYEYFN